MAYVGEYTDKFSRKYLHLNPDPLKGPGTWRLSNIPSYDDDGIDNAIENLYAILQSLIRKSVIKQIYRL